MRFKYSSVDAKGSKKDSVKRLMMGFALMLVVAGSCSTASADWADQMGEGSGVDRGVLLASVSSASGASAAQSGSLDVAAMREAIASNLSSELAHTLNTGAMPEAFNNRGVAVHTVPAGEDDDLLGLED